jgi:beta-mannosidase
MMAGVTGGEAAATLPDKVMVLDGDTWQFREITPSGFQPWGAAHVPGTVHTDLLAAGRIPDPFYKTHEKDLQWIGERDWEYRRTVTVGAAVLGAQRVELVFDGLDTFAEVSVNGVEVLSADNMFRRWRVDVRAQLHAGDNELVVRFRSPLAKVRPAYDRLGYVLPAVNDQAPIMLSMWARKAPYHYGWDWGPRFVTSGIWRSVRLETWSGARFDDVFVRQVALDDAEAKLEAEMTVVATEAREVMVAVDVAGEADPGAHAKTPVALVPGANVVRVPLRIPQPQRWWPNDLGPAKLYSVTASFSMEGKGATEAVGAASPSAALAPSVERRTVRIGLRTIEVEHRKDARGKSFTVKVNGRPVFMKGANYIPSDSFPPRVSEARLRFLVGSAAATHMNMLRVWGGGYYEDDRFYELCDELGILVWQDFMFACSMYPSDAAFLENVRLEAVDNVRRLRNHPSLALWAGNNEIETAWQGWAWPWKFGLSKAAQKELEAGYDKIFRQILPSVVASQDPGRFYTQSSPSANEPNVKANQLGWGDMHYWGVWHAEEPYTKYADNVSRFMSEYGFQSFPELASVARYTDPSDWDIESKVMLSHQRHPRGNALVRTYMKRDFRTPKDFASFLYVSQLLQATVISYAAEAHRRKMPSNAGSLYWQLDDCWPVASWSSIDYYGRWKALQYAARRFFAPELVSVVANGGAIEVWGISDRWSDRTARLRLRLLDFEGRELWRKESDVVLRANASHMLTELGRRELLRGRSGDNVVFVADLERTGPITPDDPSPRLSRSLFTFVPNKDLKLLEPELGVATTLDAAGATVTVTAKRWARWVFLSADGDGVFSDNYFDLLPGETVALRWRPPAGMPREKWAEALAHLTVRSLIDSY